jgi:hypothetical protein
MVEVYYERIQKLAHDLQVPTTDSFLTILFKACLQSYLRIATIGMQQSTLQQHKEVVMLCEKDDFCRNTECTFNTTKY